MREGPVLVGIAGIPDSAVAVIGMVRARSGEAMKAMFARAACRAMEAL
jgi:hypothetical protein